MWQSPREYKLQCLLSKGRVQCGEVKLLRVTKFFAASMILGSVGWQLHVVEFDGAKKRKSTAF